ncbi:hypothetical protein B0T24DRAFT_600523 [Lasiosphaeria ovina]|uniref:Uncharacterized protein n=1 Tax=Lasiosphaeria ovina TaxID=92902 RepID=A0AAE0NIF9_9PEZI|nr:hypothetical protein B0T24DRAFT_600523 [Lasiosphaeria ovina]
MQPGRVYAQSSGRNSSTRSSCMLGRLRRSTLSTLPYRLVMELMPPKMCVASRRWLVRVSLTRRMRSATLNGTRGMSARHCSARRWMAIWSSGIPWPMYKPGLNLAARPGVHVIRRVVGSVRRRWWFPSLRTIMLTRVRCRSRGSTSESRSGSKGKVSGLGSPNRAMAKARVVRSTAYQGLSANSGGSDRTTMAGSAPRLW